MSGPGITFDDVALYFSAEEWDILEEWQKELYRDVMVDHYQTLLSVGLMKVTPENTRNIMKGKEPAVNHKSTTSVPALETPAPEMSPVRPQGNSSLRPTPEISHNNTSGTIMNLRHKKLNLPREIFPRSTRQKEKVIHKKSEVYILPKVSDPDVDKQTQGEKPNICLHCGKTFGLWSSLIRHTKSCFRPRPCSHCGASFNYRSQRLAHHECPACGSCFLRKSSLEAHIRTHTGERLFICNLCNKVFIDQARLNSHIRFHTGENPFRCDICSKCFSDSSVLTRHRKLYCSSEKGKSKKSCPVREDPIDRAMNAEAQSVHPATCVQSGQACHSLSISKDEFMESGLDQPQVVGDAKLPTIENVYSTSGIFEEIISKDMNTLDTSGEVVNELHPIAEHSGTMYWSVTPVPNNHVKDTVNNNCNGYFILIVPPIKSSNIDTLNTTTMCEDNRVNVHFVDHLNPTNFSVKTKDDGIFLNSLCSPHESPPSANISMVVYDGEDVSQHSQAKNQKTLGSPKKGN